MCRLWSSDCKRCRRSPCSVSFASGYSYLWLLPSGPIHGGGPLPLAGHLLLDHSQNPGRRSNCLSLPFLFALLSLCVILSVGFAFCKLLFSFFFQINSPQSLKLFEITVLDISIAQTQQADFCSPPFVLGGCFASLTLVEPFCMLRTLNPNFKLFWTIGQK